MSVTRDRARGQESEAKWIPYQRDLLRLLRLGYDRNSKQYHCNRRYDQLLRLHLRLIGEIKLNERGAPRTGNGVVSMERKSVYGYIKGGLIALFVDEPCS